MTIIFGKTGMPADVDDHGGLVVLDTYHHELHEGHYYTCEYSASIANSAYLYMIFQTTDTLTDAHLSIGINAGGQCTLHLYENPDNVTTIAQLVVYCMNRQKAAGNTASLVVFSANNTSLDTGDVPLINGRLLPGGATTQTRVGGSARPNSEWVLKRQVPYLLMVQNTSGSTISINAVLEWYESHFA